MPCSLSELSSRMLSRTVPPFPCLVSCFEELLGGTSISSSLSGDQTAMEGLQYTGNNHVYLPPSLQAALATPLSATILPKFQVALASFTI